MHGDDVIAVQPERALLSVCVDSDEVCIVFGKVQHGHLLDLMLVCVCPLVSRTKRTTAVSYDIIQ